MFGLDVCSLLKCQKGRKKICFSFTSSLKVLANMDRILLTALLITHPSVLVGISGDCNHL